MSRRGSDLDIRFSGSAWGQWGKGGIEPADDNTFLYRNVHGGDKKCIQNFSREKTTWKI